MVAVAAACMMLGRALARQSAAGDTKKAVAPDYRAIPARSVTKGDAFGAWEAELYKYGHAIIHDKIVVIDPFSDNCAVVTGSHNLGYRASHNNDENIVIIRGYRGLAQAYASHVLDVYDHYAWRYWLRQAPETFGRPLAEDDKWQERYIVGKDVKAPELRFWLSAVTGGVMAPAPRRPGTATQPAGAGKRKPTRKKTGAKTSKRKAAAASAKKTRKKAAKKTARKTAKKRTRKTAKKTARKSARKTARTTARKTARRSRSRRR